MARNPIWNDLVVKTLRRWHSTGGLNVQKLARRTPATEQDWYDWFADRKNVPLGLVRFLAQLEVDPQVISDLCGLGDKYTLCFRRSGESLGQRLESAYFCAAASFGNTARELAEAMSAASPGGARLTAGELRKIRQTALEDQAAIADLIAVCDEQLEKEVA